MSPRYFTDGSGHVARVLTDSAFGKEFARAKVETYNAKRDEWVEAPGMTTDIRYSGDWTACTVSTARRIMEKAT